MFAKDTGTDCFVHIAKSSTANAMEFLAHSDEDQGVEEKEEMPIINYIIIDLIVVALTYIFAAVARSSYRGPLSPIVSLIVVAVIAVVAIAAATVVMGWSPYWLGILLVLPAYFVLTIEMRF